MVLATISYKDFLLCEFEYIRLHTMIYAFYFDSGQVSWMITFEIISFLMTYDWLNITRQYIHTMIQCLWKYKYYCSQHSFLLVPSAQQAGGSRAAIAATVDTQQKLARKTANLCRANADRLGGTVSGPRTTPSVADDGLKRHFSTFPTFPDF